MNFELNEDRRMLADALNRYLSEQYPFDYRNQAAYGAAGYSAQTYAQLAEQGAIGVLFAEADGGMGGAGADIALVFETLGQHLVAEPLLGPSPCWARCWSVARCARPAPRRRRRGSKASSPAPPWRRWRMTSRTTTTN